LITSEAGESIRQIERARLRAVKERNFGWCYAADEMYLIASEALPDKTYYDEGALYENGVGAVRRFIEAFDQGLLNVPNFDGRRVRLVTGTSMAPFLRERSNRLAEATQGIVDVVEVVNRYFGETVTVAGLLGGEDILQALGESMERDVIVLPAEALNADDLFIDDMPRSELMAQLGPVDLRFGYEVTEALKSQ